MAMIKPVSTTMGQQSLAGISGVGWYRYNGDQPYREPERSRLLPQNAKATSAKQKRMAEYGRLQLEEHLTKEQAAERLGIAASTMHYYEREFQGSLDQIAAQSPEHAALVAEYRQKQQRGDDRDG